MSDSTDTSIHEVYESLDKQLSKLGLVKGLTTKKELARVEYIKTGCMSLDNCLGGLVRGRIYEIYGPYGSCKSSLALFLCKVMQDRGEVVMWIDAEGCFTEEYAIANGVDMDRLLLIRPESMNQALEALRIAAKSEDIAMAITDSVAALVPADELEKDVGGGMLATRARLLSSILPQIVTSSAKSGCIQIFLNQVRSSNMVGYGPKTTTVGGHALPYYSSVRLELNRASWAEDASSEKVGIDVVVKVVKSKVSTPFKIAELTFRFYNSDNPQAGLDLDSDLLIEARRLGVIRLAGAWYKFGEEKYQGLAKFIDAMKADNDFKQRIIKAVLDAQDEEETR